MPVVKGGLAKRFWSQVLKYVLAVLVLFVFAAPFGWLILASIQVESELLSVPPKLVPEDPTLITYEKLLRGERLENESTEASVRTYSVPREAKLFPVAVFNSLVVSVSTMLICLVVGSLSAYSMARLHFRGSRTVLLTIVATRMIPALTLVIPFFLLANSLSMLDRKITLVIVYTTFTLPYTIWVLKSFFETIPPDLEDSARVDGCTRIQALYRVILPVSQSGLVGAGIFVLMLAWNEFFYALTLTNSEDAFTVPVVSGMFATELDIDYSLMITSGVLAVVPPVLITLVFQRFILKGLTAGSLKG